jgi:phage/plasmid-associated DNA primase
MIFRAVLRIVCASSSSTSSSEALLEKIEFRKRGALDEPAAVKANVQTYFAEENIVARFLAENAKPHTIQGMVPEIVKSRLATFAQMYGTFKDWAERNEEEFGSAKWFGNRMIQLGHTTVTDRVNVKFYQFELLFPEEYAEAA